MIKHKQALYEIFEAARINPSGSLCGKCDRILKSAGISLPGDIFNFITLGDFTLDDIVTGDLTDKYVVLYQDIVCGSVVRIKDVDAEEKAEEKSYELARLVRTLLKGNRNLVSSSYPDGAVKSSSLFGTRSEPAYYSDSQVHLAIISVRVKVHEED